MTQGQELSIYDGGGEASRLAKRTARSIVRSHSITQSRLARIADDADIATEKVEQLTYLTGNAMMAVARVNGVQKQLEQQAPELAGRLSLLAENHVLMAVEVIEATRRDMRRK